MERNIGEKFQYLGEWYKIIPDTYGRCDGCFFAPWHGGCDEVGRCKGDTRTDRRNVIAIPCDPPESRYQPTDEVVEESPSEREALMSELPWFTERMEEKLRANDHKGGVDDATSEDLFKLLLGEVDELDKAVDIEPPENIFMECADVANMAFLLAVKMRRVALDELEPELPEPCSAEPITDTQTMISVICDEIKTILLSKNRKYGDSAINPKRIFSKADPIEQINVRIDDKLSRIKSRQADDDEDPEFDLLGYLVLKMVAKRLRAEAGFGSLKRRAEND